MDIEMIKDLESEIKSKQDELNRLKYGEVYEAQDAYDAAKVVYEDARKSVTEASKLLVEARIRNGFSTSAHWQKSYAYRF